MKTFFENIVFKKQTQVLCVGIFLANRNDWRISVIRLSIQNSEINVISSAENLNDINEAGENSNQDIPVILHVDGWGVLIKDTSIENSTIPADNKEFCINEYPKKDLTGSYFSIIRTDLLKSIIEFCTSAKLNVVGLSIGPFNMAFLAPFFKNGQEIKAGKWRFNIESGSINSLFADSIDAEVSYDFAGDVITSGLLPLYASAVAFISGERGFNNLITQPREEFVYGKLVKYLTWSSLILILLLLLINFFIWDNLRNRNTELTVQVAHNEQLLAQHTMKVKELKEKESLVAQYIGTNTKTHFSWYADQLSSMLPSGIRLILMDIQPLSKKQKAGVAIAYKNRQIDVEGEATNMSEISGWVKAIGYEKWVKHVELISFSTQNDQSTAYFKLQINY